MCKGPMKWLFVLFLWFKTCHKSRFNVGRDKNWHHSHGILHVLQVEAEHFWIPCGGDNDVDGGKRGWLDHPEITTHIVQDRMLHLLLWMQDKPWKKKTWHFTGRERDFNLNICNNDSFGQKIHRTTHPGTHKPFFVSWDLFFFWNSISTRFTFGKVRLRMP